MSSLFKDLFSRKNEPFPGDVTDEDWAPVPPDKLAWPVRPLVRPPVRESWIAILKRYGEHLSDEELLIIRQQLAA